MNSTRLTLVVFAAALLSSAPACKPKPKTISELQRKEAMHLVSEAQFAAQIREWSRAEGLLAKAVQIDPNEGAYWVSLGAMRMRQGNKSGARDAYQGTLKAYQFEAVAAPATDGEPWLKQVEVLALLGRTAEARALLDEAAKKYPQKRDIRQFVEGKVFDQMLADPNFKQGAL
jgi:tetratricopeptide (TPR) repeat protein